MSKTYVPQSVLRQKAKQIKRERLLSLHRALDEASIYFGFSNYKNYLNLSDLNREKREAYSVKCLEKLRSEKDSQIAKNLSAVTSFQQKFEEFMPKLISFLAKAQDAGRDIQLLCEKQPNLKSCIESHLLKEFLEDMGGVVDDYAQYHLPKEVSVTNLTYRFAVEDLRIEGDCELKLEFAFSHTEDIEDEFFKDRSMHGSFDLSIDRDGFIIIDHLEI